MRRLSTAPGGQVGKGSKYKQNDVEAHLSETARSKEAKRQPA